MTDLGFRIKWMYCHPNFVHKTRFSQQELRIVRESDAVGLRRKFIKLAAENEKLKRLLEIKRSLPDDRNIPPYF